MAPMQATPCRSSGMMPTPAAVISPGERPVRFRPPTNTRPSLGRASPARIIPSSAWPLPSTPATPTISPGLTMTVTPSSRRLPAASRKDTPSSTSASSGKRPPDARGPAAGVAPDVAATAAGAVGAPATPSEAATVASSETMSRPTMERTSARMSARAISTLSTTRPARSTVVRSATLAISASLCVTRMTPRPPAATRRQMASSAPTSSGGSTAVGSSRTRSCGLRTRHFTISTRWRSPTERSSTGVSRLDVEVILRRQRAQSARRTRRGGAGPAEDRASGSRPRVIVGTRLKCWWTITMPALERIGGAGGTERAIVQAHGARVGRVHAEDHVAERGLARAVLAEQAVNLARPDRRARPRRGR